MELEHKLKLFRKLADLLEKIENEKETKHFKEDPMGFEMFKAKLLLDILQEEGDPRENLEIIKNEVGSSEIRQIIEVMAYLSIIGEVLEEGIEEQGEFVMRLREVYKEKNHDGR